MKLSRISSFLSRYVAYIYLFRALRWPYEYFMSRSHKKHNSIAYSIGLLLLVFAIHEDFAIIPTVLYLETTLDLPAFVKVVCVSLELVSWMNSEYHYPHFLVILVR